MSAALCAGHRVLCRRNLSRPKEGDREAGHFRPTYFRVEGGTQVRLCLTKQKVGTASLHLHCHSYHIRHVRGGGVEEGGRGEEPPWVALARNDSDVGCDRGSGM